jgi:uncharacterized protein YcbK (DUF882 family)
MNATRYFQPFEFNCKCCGHNYMEQEFIERLDTLREACDFPFEIVSGYRCKLHNSRVSSTGDNGPHTTGRAADIACGGERAITLLSHACKLGLFTGIGVKQHGASRFIHLDDLPPHIKRPRPWIWTYP